MAGGRIVAERFTQGTNASMVYFAGDHLGSTVALTNTGGLNAPSGLQEQDSWDAWGKRRNKDGSDNAPCGITSSTLRGSTGQEMMDSFCLVNLNGRFYDPSIGRFLSADPTIPDPHNGQSFNLYSYVLNNPLAFTDPSGYTDNPCSSQSGHCVYSEGSSPSVEWYCSCASIGETEDAFGNVVPAANFSGGYNFNTIGWSPPNLNAPDCGGGTSSGCWTPSQAGDAVPTSTVNGIETVTVPKDASYWVPPSTGASISLNGALGGGSFTASIAEHGAGPTTISENLKLYVKGFKGNQWTKTASLSKMGRSAGWLFAGGTIIADSVELAAGDISQTQFNIDMSMTLLGLTGPIGAGVSGMYYIGTVINSNYPGGIGSFAMDYGTLEQQNSMDAGKIAFHPRRNAGVGNTPTKDKTKEQWNGDVINPYDPPMDPGKI